MSSAAAEGDVSGEIPDEILRFFSSHFLFFSFLLFLTFHSHRRWFANDEMKSWITGYVYGCQWRGDDDSQFWFVARRSVTINLVIFNSLCDSASGARRPGRMCPPEMIWTSCHMTLGQIVFRI